MLLLPDALSPVFERVFLEESNELMVLRLRFALTVGLVLYGSFAGLDWLSHPQLWTTFLPMRVGVVLLSALVIRATHTEWGRRHILPLSMMILLVAALGISVMTTYLDGFSSDYYIGNMLVLFFVGMFMPWPRGATMLFCALLCGPYFAMNGLMHGASQALVSPFFFLLGTSAFTHFATVAGETSRRRDLMLRLQVEEVNAHLKEVDEAKSRFFANVSHELRTPLMLITGPLGELLERETDPSARAMLESMEVNAERLVRHVNMILDFAAMEGDSMKPRPTIGNLGRILHDLVKAALPHASTLGVRLETEGLDRSPDTMFDLEQIETLAANLLSNAVKFTPEGGLITVRAFADRSTVGFEVEDTGQGIPDDQLERIFDRFHQVEGADRGKNKGTGLGLALCRELAGRHDGSLTVISALGHGSCFRVELPREAAEVGHVAVAPTGRQQPRLRRLLADIRIVSPQPRLDSDAAAAADAPLVLVVEDNDELCAFMARSLGADYRIQTAADGRLGLAAARQHAPDLIVSDIMMPNMTGTELVAELAADPALRLTPVILLSARAGTDAVVEGLDGGAVDYVTKPFHVRELKARIQAHLRTRDLERTLDERETRLAAVGQMTAGIAHDLHGPLTAIVGHVQLAQILGEGMDGYQDLAEDLEAVEAAGRRAVRMIEELVAFSRGGSLVLEPEPTHLGEFVAYVGRSMTTSLTPIGIELRVETYGTETDLYLPVDRERMQRVLENLITNAREAIVEMGGRSDGGRIDVRVSADSQSVRIRVSDDGPGIEQDVIERLFNPFVTSGKAGGTGLGLAIVRNLVSAHGGTVCLDSSDVGAAFLVTLPRPTAH